ncbi:succinate--hydroxymethylglutarate CoA-transferase [Diorhabda sublineata]|uniref:succinate--hydroxymethylglutarate CoA-transferase n=1 Tax=Diorhabda sublineata TaxID=1163346 RepID=UPI0024E0828C|nr:succinate--hydroxymethylglutarate CoA-transferase [Diorhabda sublineata]
MFLPTYRILRQYNKQINSFRKKSVSSSNGSESPLDGIRIIDLTRIIAGPFCTMVLSDLGAEVIKVEQPNHGDPCRKWGPFINNTHESCYFISINRNKKSMCVDLKHPEGKNILLELARKSDVLIENYVPGKLDELHLGYKDFKKVAPHLIYCSVTGFGPKGPYRDRPGYDVIASSMGGLIHSTGALDGEPVKVGVAITDITTGLYAHGAIMAALFKRTRTGRGQKIDCNLLSTQLATLINLGSNYLNVGKESKRWGTAHESIVPYESFPTKDGYFTVGAGSDAQFRDFCKRINHPELSQNSKYSTNELRVRHRQELEPLLRSIMKMKSNEEWNKIFLGASFPYGPVNTLKAVFEDEHIKAINLVKTLDHPVAGKIKVVGPPVTYNEGGNYVKSPPPVLGQHTNEILTNLLNLDEDHIEDLRKRNIVQ